LVEDATMPEKITLLGAGGMCREIISIIEDINSAAGQYELHGILDDDPELLGKSILGCPVLGRIDDSNLPSDSRIALCVATHRNIASRAGVGNRIGADRERWARLIHPQATVAASAVLDPGVILYAGARVGASVRIGLNSFLYYNAVIHHDSSLGSHTQVCAGVLIAGNVHIGDRCYLGIGSVIRDGLSVADDTMIGMGAVVTGNVTEPGKVLKGFPARQL
jgi:sugar O-acyltransferase (sialic acid O-acetyltransferase NeuD family)